MSSSGAVVTLSATQGSEGRPETTGSEFSTNLPTLSRERDATVYKRKLRGREISFASSAVEEEVTSGQSPEDAGSSDADETDVSLPSEISYQEYEEDESMFARSGPRSKESRLLLLLRQWKELQPADRRRGLMSRKPGKAQSKEHDASLAEEVEQAKYRLIKEMQEDIRTERYNEERKAALEAVEASTRDAQLRQTILLLYEYQVAYEEDARAAEQRENWNRYMTCDGLPDPGELPDMNTFMFLWTMQDEEASMDTVAEKCQVVTYLLDKLEEILRFCTTVSEEYVAECEAMARRFREKLERWIDFACYRLLRKIETDMTMEDMKNARHVHASDKITCCVWAPIALPIGMKRHTEKERKPIEVCFDEIELTVKMPVDVDCHHMAIRGLWLSFDHYSVEAASRSMPKISEAPDWNSLDLLEFCSREYLQKLRIREDQAEERRQRLEERRTLLQRIEHPPASTGDRKARRQRRKGPQSARKGKKHEAEAELAFGPLSWAEMLHQLPQLPTPEEIVRKAEDEARKETRKSLFLRCEKTEVNLRKYKILGGVFRVDLIYQPPQPKDIGGDSFLTTLELPKEPRFVPFSRPYQPPAPAPDSERTPEVIEAEIKALEAAMEALALVNLKLPSSVLWFEPPLVAHWIPEKKAWSTKDVHDIKYNEEKQTIAFRTGRLGIHGLAAYKYVNLPFQSWELKPEMGRSGRGGVILNVTAATVQAEFVVREDLVCLNSLAGGPSGALKPMLGEYTKLHDLIERMQEAGCDLFPEPDAASYLKGLAIKHPVTERHLWKCMSLLSTAYTFGWSRWNASRDAREIVLQFKEMHGCVAKERTNVTLLITPLRTMPIRCTEVSSEFSNLPLDEENVKFYADLYQLALGNAGIKSRLLIRQISFKLVATVTQLLERTNVISMSS